MKPIPKLLSKTKLMKGYRCLKCIYLTIHKPELEAPISPETQALFNQGNAVGIEARKFFPNGILIDNTPWDFTGALAKTRELITSGAKVIYEAAFEYMGCYARADIIQYSPDSNRWRIYEVKSTTKVKDEHIDDVGLQAWIMAKSGLQIESIHIMHLNTACRYPDLSNLFSSHDITDKIRDTYLGIKPRLRDIFSTIRQPETPDIDIGPHCLAPIECGFKAHCWKEKNIPEFSLFDLPNMRQRVWDLYHENIVDPDDDRLTDLNEIQERIIHCHKTGERYFNKTAIKEALSTWQFPLVFLDFETINPAIPRYDNCGPYQHTPFQFSVHILEDINGETSHYEFLHTSADDPRPALIPSLLSACGNKGSIVAYYSKFEAARNSDLAAYAPEYADALNKLNDRLVDPLPIIRDHLYDNALHGSFSLKKVAPALLGDEHSYTNMMVGNGGEAQRAFEELISEKTTAHKKETLHKAMLDYCEKDTFVMVQLVKWLFKACA